jgi:hypothetical protein
MADKGEAERFREAADEALQQLDWCIGYLHGIRKSQLSYRLAQNRDYIKKNLMRKPVEPLPSSTTGET